MAWRQDKVPSSRPIMSIGIAGPIVVHNIERLLLIIIGLHRHNRATGRKLLFIMARLLFRYAHCHESAEKTSRYRSKCSTKDGYQDTTREGWSYYRNK